MRNTDGAQDVKISADETERNTYVSTILTDELKLSGSTNLKVIPHQEVCANNSTTL